jgi:tetratricopeptide (TPR) repeat protein
MELDAEAPPLGDSWGAVSRLASTLGEVSLAISAMHRFVSLAPYDPERRLAYGALLAGAGRVEAALEAMLGFLPHARPDARLMLFIGTCHAQLGHGERALDALQQGLALSPSQPVAGALWLALSDLHRFTPDDSMLAAMTRAAASPQAPSTQLYALAKAMDDTGDADAAFALYERGAAAMRQARPFDAEASGQFVRDLIAGMTPQHLGAPRSGTTLVEQILASHSAVAGGAELNLFRVATMSLNGYSPAHVEAYEHRPGSDWTALGQAYLHLLDERFGPEGRVVDKTLNHSRFVGLIRHVLPAARFLWLRRDAGDTALSCYRSHFAEGVNWSWSMADIGRQFRDEDALHRHWTDLFPEAILTVPYEALVTDPDTWIDRILQHCGLPFESAVRQFHLTRRSVATTSGSQVRQPIYQRAVGGWRRYAAHMQPFFEAYGSTPDA